jgi:tetratricopeptide (TPR) repeat protein
MAKEPRSAEDHFKRGLARYAARDLEGAIEDFTKAIVVNSNFDTRALKRIKHVKSDQYNNGSSDLSEKFSVMDKFNARAYFCRGNARADKGDLRGAIQDFDKAIAFNPQDSGALNNRGYARRKTGDTDGAIKDFDRAILMDPDNSQAHNNCGTLRFEQKDFVGAVAAFSRAIEADSQMAVAYKNRGLAYKAQGEFDKACKDFDRAIELDASLLPAYLNRGLILIRQGKDTEAEKDFAYFLRYAGDMKDTHKKLIQQARESRQHEE